MEAGKVARGVFPAHWWASLTVLKSANIARLAPPMTSPRGAIVLPEAALHPSQAEALDLIRASPRRLGCGRRWGKWTI